MKLEQRDHDCLLMLALYAGGMLGYIADALIHLAISERAREIWWRGLPI